MTLRSAAVLALIGTLLLTILTAVDFIRTVVGVVHDVIPAMALVRAFICLLGAASVTVFFFVFSHTERR